MRVIVILTSTLLLTRVSNSSVIYHWIRGQSLFKLYMIKAVFEISDLLLKGFGQALIENFARDFYLQTSWVRRAFDVVMMTGYTAFHAMLLTLEMFTIHVALTSSDDSVFSFLFYNNFAELKITVFKKVDVPGLYQYACNDGVERLQLMIYLMNIFASTSQDKRVIFNYMFFILAAELLIDWIKHFFITRLNRLRSDLYLEFTS
jgi:hypothetical protein